MRSCFIRALGAVALFLLTACTKNTTPITNTSATERRDIAFSTVVPVPQMNSILQLQLDSETPNSLRFGSDITLYLENLSTDTIWFPVDRGVRIFSYSPLDDKWIPVENRVVYRTGEMTLQTLDGTVIPSDQVTPGPRAIDGIFLYPQGQVFSDNIVDIKPNITTAEETVEIRVVVTGNRYVNNVLTEPVGAYIDLTLTAK